MGTDKAVTLWFVLDKDNKPHFNHLEDGHCLNDIPTEKVNGQAKLWNGQKWSKLFKYLDQTNKVIDHVRSQS